MAARHKTRWLVMVYMVAKNVPGEAGPLTNEAEDDIREMKKGHRHAKHPPVRVVYQLHTEDQNERLVIGEGVAQNLKPEDQVVSDGSALSNFVEWALQDAIKAGAFTPGRDRTMLVMWGHAYRFELGAAITQNGVDAIDFAELEQRFRKLQQRLTAGLGSKPKLDILAFDTCDLATVEVAVQLSPFADFILASEMGMPLPGWPYDDIIKRLASPKGDQLEPAELCSYVVRQFCQHYKAKKRAVSLSALNLTVSSELADLVDSLARALARALGEEQDEVDVIQTVFEGAQTVLDKPFVDVASLCLGLSRYSASQDVRVAAQALGDFLVTPLQGPDDETHVAKRIGPSNSDIGANRPFVTEYGRNACEAGALQGVSLYAPNVLRDSFDWLAVNHWYEKFLFTRQRTIWYELVKALSLPD